LPEPIGSGSPIHSDDERRFTTGGPGCSFPKIFPVIEYTESALHVTREGIANAK